MDFNKFIGNESVKSHITTLLKNNKVSHAIMIDGAKGLGKKTFAELIAQSSICSHPLNGQPCNDCANCKKVLKHIHPDIIYPEKSGVLQSYSITTVRKIREDAYIIPNEASKKIYIFTDIDNMGIPAQNALLKILEEPPKNVIFILTCTACSSVLPTIRSRTQLFSLKPVSIYETLDYLCTNYPDKDNETLNKIAKMSNGNIGLAIDLLTSNDFEKLMDITNKIALHIIDPKEFELLSLIAMISDNRKSFNSVLKFLKSILRDTLIYSSGLKNELSENNCILELSRNLSVNQILNLIDIIDKTKNYMDKNVNLSVLSSYLCSNLHKIAFTQ